jgi:multidrug efflux pump subunit AcrA (membrane-fusion protein)
MLHYVYKTLLAAGAALLMGACGNQAPQAAPKAPPPLSVETVTVTQKKFPLWVEFTGMTKAISDQEIRACFGQA